MFSNFLNGTWQGVIGCISRLEPNRGVPGHLQCIVLCKFPTSGDELKGC